VHQGKNLGVKEMEQIKRTKAHQEGIEAHQNGLTDADNPYQIGTDAAMDWEDGRAEAENQEDEE